MPFPLAKPIIDASPIFTIINRMPKGGILHAHSGSCVDFHWVIKNATYIPSAYIYLNASAINETSKPLNGSMQHFNSPPGGLWFSIPELRAQWVDPVAFDEMLVRTLLLPSSGLNGNLFIYLKIIQFLYQCIRF